MQEFFEGSLILDQRTEKKQGIANIDAKDMEKSLGQSFYHDSDFNDHGISAITLTFRQYYHDMDTLELHKEIYHFMMDQLAMKKTNVKIMLYPEFTKDMNLHYHGCIQGPKTVRATILKAYKNRYGFYYISKLNDFEKWFKYCTKEYEDTPDSLLAINIVKSKYLTKEQTEKRKQKSDHRKLQVMEVLAKSLDEDTFFKNLNMS